MNRDPLHTLTASQVADFERAGVIVLRNAIDQDWVEALRAPIERDIENPTKFSHKYESDGEGQFHGSFYLWKVDETCRDFVLNGPLAPLAAQLLGSETVNFFYDQLFVKDPGALNPIPWHNDQPYWPVSGRQVMSFWIALDPVRKESGAVEYVRGSHNWGRWFQPRPFAKGATEYDENPDYEPMIDVENNRDEYDIVSWDMEPGDALAFHAMIVHGSRGNQSSDLRRRGYAVRYTGADARYDPRPGTAKIIWAEDVEPGAQMTSNTYPLVWPRRNAERAAE